MQGRVAPSLRSSALLCDTPIWLLSLKPMLLRVERRCRTGRQSWVSARICEPTGQERTALLNMASLRGADALTLRIRGSSPVRLPQLACALLAWHPRKLEAPEKFGLARRSFLPGPPSNTRPGSVQSTDEGLEPNKTIDLNGAGAPHKESAPFGSSMRPLTSNPNISWVVTLPWPQDTRASSWGAQSVPLAVR